MNELNKNQENQEWGGRREGAGRPKGSGHKPKITDDLTEEEKKELLKSAYNQALEGDAKLKVFFLEQIYGKARQSIELEGEIDMGEKSRDALSELVNMIKNGQKGNSTENSQ